MKKSLLSLAAAMTSLSSFASDHIDGPVTTKHAVGDISDFYAFPSPKNADNLSLVINMYPILPKHAHFSQKVQVSAIIRKASIDEESRLVKAEGEELKITCSFNDAHAEPHQVTCTSNSGLRSVATVDENSWEGDFSLFAGKRSDPFFFNADWAKAATLEGKILEPAEENSLDKLNVLSVIMEIERSKIFDGEFELLALSTTSHSYGRQLDTIGRPEMTNVVLATHEGQAELRDAYNQQKPFTISPNNKERFAKRIFDNVKYFDGLDQKQDWQPHEINHFSDILLNDYLVLDLSKDCSGNSYLSIEKAVMEGREHSSCGGRKVTDDIMFTLFNTLINKEKGPLVSDGVDAPQSEISNDFPYLTKANTGFFAWVKAKLAGLKLDR